MSHEFVTEGLSPDLALAVVVVGEALAMAREPFATADVRVKSGRDLVTSRDLAVEDHIRARLAEQLGVVCVGEERGGSPPDDGSGYWLVDPICGTTNFAAGLPLYAINLALVQGDAVLAAVVGDASSGRILVAERDDGAFVLGGGSRSRALVSDRSDTIVFEDSKAVGENRTRAANFARLLIEMDRWNFRSFGTSLSLALVATGQISGYVDFVHTHVHGAAGVLIASEAGATITDLEGVAWSLESRSLIAASTRSQHDTLLSLATAARESGDA